MSPSPTRLSHHATLPRSSFNHGLLGDGALGRQWQRWFGDRPDTYHTLEDSVKDVIDGIERGGPAPLLGLSTGFMDLDEFTSGLQAGDLINVGGGPSIGKTAFALSISHCLAVSMGVSVAILCPEMYYQDIVVRLLAIHTGVHLHRLRTRHLLDEDRRRLIDIDALTRAPIYIDDTSGLTAAAACGIARRLKRKRGVGLVVVDHLQAIATENGQKSRCAGNLKSLARELQVPVLLLSAVRTPPTRTDRRPQLSDLWDRGEHADAVMFVYRPDVYGLEPPDGYSLEQTAEIIIAKQRNGPIGSVFLKWIAHSASFEDLAPGPRPSFCTTSVFQRAARPFLTIPLRSPKINSSRRRLSRSSPSTFSICFR